MRIVYCTDSILGLGGIQRVTVTKANALAAIPGNEVWIAVTDNIAGTACVQLSPKVRLVDLGVNYYADDTRSKLHVLKGILVKRRRHRRLLATLLGSIKPDVVVATGTSEKYFVPGLARRCGAASVREIHFTSTYRLDHARKTGSLFDLVSARVADVADFRLGIRGYDRVVLLTEEDRAAHWEGNERAVVMPNPVSFSAPTAAQLESCEIVAAGRLDAGKDFATLIRVCARVFARHPEWHLTIYGEGPERPALEGLVRELGLEGSVSLPGMVTDVRERMLGASIFALTSRYEGFGLVLVEAMECGVPPVAMACKCGPRDIITHGTDGFLCEPGDEEGMARHICALIDDPSRRRRMGEAARRRASDFSITAITGRWMQLFNTLRG